MKTQKTNLPVSQGSLSAITTRLKHIDCQQLLDRILSRIKLWTAASLSYAGRLQLIKSVIFSIQVYWSSIFLLPQATLKKIDQLLSAFLWKGTSLGHSGAKVAWHKICVPKEEGGLGVMRIKEWNKAALSKHIWRLHCNENSLWTNWTHKVILRGRSFWTMKACKNSSWTWQKLLNSRTWCRDLISSKIGNGEDTEL